MNTFNEFRVELIAEYTSDAVRTADRIQKKINLLEFNGLFRINEKYVRISEKDTAFNEIGKIKLSKDAERWLTDNVDILEWQISAFTLKKINTMFKTKLKLFEFWDLAETIDSETILIGFQNSIDIEDVNWLNLDESTQNDIRIIFDAIDNSKYFLHSIDGYFPFNEGIMQDRDYYNHLLARL